MKGTQEKKQNGVKNGKNRGGKIKDWGCKIGKMYDGR